jgi:hypothetical protein
LLHNTADHQRAGNDGFKILSPGTWQLLYTHSNVWENANPTQPLDMDYDDLWSSGSYALVRWDGLSNTHLATIPALTAATGQQSRDLNAARARRARS